ncbi:hypothetical protein [Streptomyces sp. NBC_00111]|uniref:hypothetical protein n=1 Tax=Streptomyces sp. NBC_00111 TaxID=2975655 RepID=UPI003868756D
MESAEMDEATTLPPLAPPRARTPARGTPRSTAVGIHVRVHAEYKEPLYAAPLHGRGRLGRKAGSGFHSYC